MSIKTKRDDDALIHDIHDCTPEEVRTHLLYLIYTPVCHYACSIARREHRLMKGLITSLRLLGSTPTIFQNFGQVTATGAVGRPLFLVSDVLETLRRADHLDDEVLHKVETFIAMEAAGQLDLVVTLAQSDGQYIVDGNKRAVAYYESRRGHGSDVTALPIYLITPA